MFALPFMRRRSGGGAAASIPPGTYATPQDLATAISQLIGGAPPATLDTIAEVAAYAMNNADTVAAISAAIANKQDKHARLTALSALALAADKLIYATGENTLAATALTAFMRSVLAAQDAAGARAAIGALGGADAGTFGRGVLALDAPTLGSVPFAGNGAGTAGMIVTKEVGRAFMSADNPAAESIFYSINGAGGLSSFPSGPGGRRLTSLVASPAYSIPMFDSGTGVTTLTTTNFSRGLLTTSTASLTDWAIPMAAGSSGDLVFVTTTSFSRSMASLGTAGIGTAGSFVGFDNLSTGRAKNWPVTFFGTNLVNLTPTKVWQVPVTGNVAGIALFIDTGLYGRTVMQAETAKAGRAATGRKAGTAYFSGSAALAVNSAYDVYFSGMEASLGYDLPNATVGDSGTSSGRITGTGIGGDTAVVFLSGSVVVDGPCELVIDWSLTSIYGAAYVPASGGGLPRAEAAQVPSCTMIRIPKAGRAIFQGPQNVPLSGLGNRAQIRVTVMSNAAVNMTGFSVRIDQEAVEATS